MTRSEPAGQREPGAGRQPGAAAIVLASGSGTRVGAELNKVYLPLAGRRLVSWSVNAFAEVQEIDLIVLVIRPQDQELAASALAEEITCRDVEVVHGGATRQASELNALRHLAARIGAGRLDTVLIHDAARPLVTPDLISDVLRAARKHGGAVPGLPRRDLAAVGADGSHVVGLAPGELVAVQTPQGFRAAPLLAAYEAAERDGFLGTDTASCMERFSDVPVHWVPGEQRNFKITYAHDLLVAEQLLARPRHEPG